MNDKITVEDLDALVAELFKQRAICDSMSAQWTEENKKLAAMQAKVTTYLKELGRKEYKTPEGGLSIVQKWQVTLPKGEENRTKFFNYLKEQGVFDSLISVNSNTLQSYYKTEFENAKAQGNFEFELPGLGPATLHETITMRKAK